MVVGSSPVAVSQISDFAPVLSEEFLDIQATIGCGFIRKSVRDMTRTYSQSIRNFNFLKCKEFSRLDIFYFSSFGFKSTGPHFRKYKKSFLLRKCLILDSDSSIS